MTNNPYVARLRRELDYLIKRKVALRNLLRRGPLAFSGDWLDQRLGMERAAMELSAAERRHAELRHELGIPEHGGPVKIGTVAESMAEIARIKARSRAGSTSTSARGAVKLNVPGYVTRMLGHPGCR
jgi:hypothetical protein